MTKLDQLYALAEQEGIEVLCFNLECAALSVMEEDGHCCIGIDPMRLNSHADETLKLAHELGHCMTGGFYNRYSPYDLRRRHEVRANRWMVKALIPRSDLRAQMRRGNTEVWQLAEALDMPEHLVSQALELYAVTRD